MVRIGGSMLRIKGNILKNWREHDKELEGTW
jgi:hypothetical protein